MFSFVARQAIFDENMNTVGYELLFRDSMTNRFPDVTPEYATAQIIVEQFLGAPLGRLKEYSAIFVNFPYELLVQGMAETLPKDRVIVEILETAEPTPRLLQTVKQLYKHGFRIALDDFELGDTWNDFLPYVSIIKFDVRMSTPEAIKAYIKNKADLLEGTVFLAEKVETEEEYACYKKLGCTLFQGHYFSKPVIHANNKLIQNQSITLKLMKEVNADSPDFVRIEALLKQDLALSFKLMRYAQNIVFNARGIKNVRSQSLKDIIFYLGTNELRRFVLVACLTSVNVGKTDEIYHRCLIRGKFCELAAARSISRHSSDDAFIVGLFSQLDDIFEMPMADLIGQIDVSANVMMALREKRGPLYPYLHLAQLYENHKWEDVSALGHRLGFNRSVVAELMKTAAQWADEIPGGTTG
ncbi:TPA: EAL domain-containing protein [Kluyvera intermedia]|uniref:EAL and HDOD domain-containing protein n=1 Tax=Citrobacter sp. MNAZ 1397 TaxID=2911205 RepID=UPI001A2A463C|nr:EAL domain-containing protein [Citrobacter sp. MNAZ 1397]MCL9672153.1 EAL domain-containing protein [Citrobacter sp. MNAZ 1397]MDU6683619.1 EAL domain-containing protein [Enterobacteriaceae bacterium]HAT2608402.1 EAL domain-containing protein [Kluyvera intermedia]HAU8266032.1 EAL domain-containing protein [Kluyvera intermedia]